MNKRQIEQLRQLDKAGLRGVFAGDLLDKPTTRDLVRDGWADNGMKGGGSPSVPSALSRVYITKLGKQALWAWNWIKER